MDLTEWKAYAEETNPVAKRSKLQKLLVDNEKFVVANVQRLVRRGLTSPLLSVAETPLEDLIQAGRIGYMRALERFNPERGAFPTYAKHWIRHEVQQAAIMETSIRKPKDAGVSYGALMKMTEIRTRYGREATAEELGISAEEHAKWKAAPVVVSYHSHQSPMDQDSGDSADTTMEDTEGLNPEEIMGLSEMRDSVERLPPDERAVIHAMFFTEFSVIQICKQLGLSCSELYELRDAGIARLKGEV